MQSYLDTVRTVTACDGYLCSEKQSKLLLRYWLRALPVCPLDLPDRLWKRNKGCLKWLPPEVWASVLYQNWLITSLPVKSHTTLRAEGYCMLLKKGAHFVQTIFLKVAHVLLLVVLCSKMAVLLISSPTFSLKKKKSLGEEISSCPWTTRITYKQHNLSSQNMRKKKRVFPRSSTPKLKWQMSQKIWIRNDWRTHMSFNRNPWKPRPLSLIMFF